jgi:hypothetical protein
MILYHSYRVSDWTTLKMHAEVLQVACTADDDEQLFVRNMFRIH